MKMNPLRQFLGILTISVLVVFGLHLSFLYYNQHPLFAHKIVLAYILNYGLAIGIYALLYFFRVKLKNQLGFLFMAGSFLKFIFFFLFFYTSFIADGNINTLEFSSFFVPYVTCLIIETYLLVNLLHNLK